MSERAAQTIGGAAVLIGVGIGVAVFTVDAEQPGAHGGSGWGGTGGVIILCVWVGLMCIGPVIKLARPTRQGRKSDDDTES